jgi:ribosome-associated protein
MTTNNSQSTDKALQFAKQAARIAYDNRSEDVTILDLRGLTAIADFFVIATGSSDRQMRAVVDEIDEFAAEIGEKRYGLGGYDSTSWILADYVDVVIHVFDEQRRRFYDLELLWGDAPRIDWQEDEE